MLTAAQMNFNKKIAIGSSIVLLLVVGATIYEGMQTALDSTIQRTIAMTAAIFFSSPFFTLPATMLAISSVRLATKSESQKNAYFWAAATLFVSSFVAIAAALIWKEYAVGLDGLAFLALYLYLATNLILSMVMFILSRKTKKQ